MHKYYSTCQPKWRFIFLITLMCCKGKFLERRGLKLCKIEDKDIPISEQRNLDIEVSGLLMSPVARIASVVCQALPCVTGVSNI